MNIMNNKQYIERVEGILAVLFADLVGQLAIVAVVAILAVTQDVPHRSPGYALLRTRKTEVG